MEEAEVVAYEAAEAAAGAGGSGSGGGAGTKKKKAVKKEILDDLLCVLWGFRLKRVGGSLEREALGWWGQVTCARWRWAVN